MGGASTSSSLEQPRAAQQQQQQQHGGVRETGRNIKIMRGRRVRPQFKHSQARRAPPAQPRAMGRARRLMASLVAASAVAASAHLRRVSRRCDTTRSTRPLDEARGGATTTTTTTTTQMTCRLSAPGGKLPCGAPCKPRGWRNRQPEVAVQTSLSPSA